MGSIVFSADFEFYLAVWGGARGPIRLVGTWRSKFLDSQPGQSSMGPFPIDFHEICDFHKSCRGFLTRYLSCFWPRAIHICIFEAFGRNQKDARRKVMQIRGGITSGSAFFDLFVPIQDFHCLTFSEAPSRFPAAVLPKKVYINCYRQPFD